MEQSQNFQTKYPINISYQQGINHTIEPFLSIETRGSSIGMHWIMNWTVDIDWIELTLFNRTNERLDKKFTKKKTIPKPIYFNVLKEFVVGLLSMVFMNEHSLLRLYRL